MNYYANQQIYTIMLHHLILHPSLPVEDAIEQVVLTTYLYLELVIQFNWYQDELLSELSQLLCCSPPPATTAVSADSNSEVLIYSVYLRLQP